MARRRDRPINRHWTGFAGHGAAFTAGTLGILIGPALHDRETVMRTRGEMLVNIDATQAPGGRAQISLGLILVPEGTGTTVLWSPFTDDDAPWFWYWTGMLGYEEMVTDVIDIPGLTSVRETIDSKSMRILRNQEIQLVAENTTISSAVSVNFDVVGRILTQE